MNGVPKVRGFWWGLAVTALALSVAYASIEGLVTGRTRAIARASYAPLTGAQGTVTAIAYGVFAIALGAFAVMCFSVEPERQDALFRWGRNIAIASAVILFSALLFQ